MFTPDLVFTQRRDHYSLVLALVAVTCFALELLPLIPAILLLLLWALLKFYISGRHSGLTSIAWLLALITGVAIGLYRPADFHYPLLLRVERFYPGGEPFALYLNVGKALAGYLLLFWLLYQPAYGGYWRKTSTWAMPWIVTTDALLVLLVVVTAAFTLPLAVVPKFSAEIAVFLINNLIITCVAEEVFMRLLVQRQLGLWTQAVVGKFDRFRKTRIAQLLVEVVPIVVATILFAATHGGPASPAFSIFLLAGAAYALAYSLNKSVWSSVAVHFGVNALHIGLLEYPLS